MKFILTTIAIAAQTLTALAGTYFVDNNAANDSANGTAKTTPWKRCPGMLGFTGSYTHQAGDRFIFKGGVTWPRSCFTMNVSSGGSSASNQDYYGVDQTWFSGSSWSRPIFDYQNGQPGGVDGLWISAPYVTIDNIALINYSGLTSFGHGIVSTYPLTGSSLPAGAVRVINCLVQDYAYCTGVYGPFLELGYCEFTQQNILVPATGFGPNGSAGYSPGMLLSSNSVATSNVNWIHHTRIHHCGSIMPYSAGTFTDNNFGPPLCNGARFGSSKHL